MLLKLPHRHQRRFQTLALTLRHRWRRLLFFLCSAWVFSVYARRKHPFLHRAHEITSHDIDFETVHPPSVNIDTNSFLPLPAAKALCSAHRFPRYTPRNEGRRKIYDLIMINNEMDWLEIRLEEMGEHVDYFVIVESKVTFTGMQKELVVKENWDRFEKWQRKIVYHVLEDPPIGAKRTWDLEDFQRNAMFVQAMGALEGERAPKRGDVIVVADVDEIVRPAALLVLRNCDVPKRVTLRSRFYYYGFQWLHRGEEWAHPQATTYQGGNTILPADLRNGEGGNGLLAWWDKADLWNAGWHCSSCFKTVDEVLNKMASFSHTGLNQEVFRDRMRIVDRVRKGKDLWDREGEVYERIEGNGDIPKLVNKERERFGYLLDRDGPNAGFVDMGTGEVTGD